MGITYLPRNSRCDYNKNPWKLEKLEDSTKINEERPLSGRFEIQPFYQNSYCTRQILRLSGTR